MATILWPIMDTDEIVEAIDQEIQRLEAAKALLAEGSGSGLPRQRNRVAILARQGRPES